MINEVWDAWYLGICAECKKKDFPIQYGICKDCKIKDMDATIYKRKWEFVCFIPKEATYERTLGELLQISSSFKVENFTDVKVRITVEVIDE